MLTLCLYCISLWSIFPLSEFFGQEKMRKLTQLHIYMRNMLALRWGGNLSRVPPPLTRRYRLQWGQSSEGEEEEAVYLLTSCFYIRLYTWTYQEHMHVQPLRWALSIWGFGALHKDTSAVLYKCPTANHPASSPPHLLHPFLSHQLTQCPNTLSLASLAFPPTHLTHSSLWRCHSWSSPSPFLPKGTSTPSSLPPPALPPVSKPRSTACWTTTFDTFPLVLDNSLLSNVTPDIFLHPFRPACMQLFTSFPQFLLLRSVDPKYLNSSAVLFLPLISVTSQLNLGPSHSPTHPNPVWYSLCAIIVCECGDD